MVIINFRAGQLANRLFHFSHFIVNSIEFDYKLINPFFDEYCEFFDSTAFNNFSGYKIKTNFFHNRILNKILRKSLWIISRIAYKIKKESFFYNFHNITNQNDKSNIDYNMNYEYFIKEARNKVLFADGWCYRDFVNFKKRAEELKIFFTPTQKYLLEVQDVIEECKKFGDLVIGVHIRRGDYISFNQGEWYYDDNIYFEKMSQFKDLMIESGKKCVFLICSNEKINKENYKGLTIITDNRHFITDLYSLSKCDYLIGPPSTFTMWASFYGNVPLLVLNSDDQKVVISEFNIVTEG